MYAIRSYYDLFSDGKNFIMNENLFFYQGNTVNLTDYFMVDSSCWHISYNSQTAELYQYFNPETAQEDLSVAEIIPVYDALYYLLYRSQDNRITSYNVCYTKLLRIFLAGIGDEECRNHHDTENDN